MLLHLCLQVREQPSSPFTSPVPPGSIRSKEKGAGRLGRVSDNDKQRKLKTRTREDKKWTREPFPTPVQHHTEHSPEAQPPPQPPHRMGTPWGHVPPASKENCNCPAGLGTSWWLHGCFDIPSWHFSTHQQDTSTRLRCIHHSSSMA